MLKNPSFFATFACILLSILSLKVRSQKWELGIVSGIGIVSTTRDSKIDYPKTFRGFGEGLSLRYQVTQKFAILANFFYEQKVNKTKTTVVDYQGVYSDAYIKDRLQRLSLPLMASWSFGKKTKFVLNIGGFVSHLLKETLEIDALLLGGPKNQTLKIDVTRTPRTDAGVILGFGVLQPLTPRASLSLELRNYAGLIDHASQGSPVYLNYQTLILGLSFKLGKA